VIEFNPSYHPWSMAKLLDLHYWHHLKPAINKQGRVSYFNEAILKNTIQDDDDDFNDDMSEVSNNCVNPEQHIQLFTSCYDDEENDTAISSWTTRQNGSYVVMESNTWPGAFAFTKNR
jgi:hypothetical protein